ncbi:hypothetical protein GSI_08409 [Ganoderma sinense ZZ0214-1]|uniref:Uncharacterized protein n=1 Tax=Ganoderma sinense ZZ0214-1 TaxID=1077348 RepID=A0A2G8S6W1_9APHY|nr:hypothetical protein GSI_08409 [Ganoderma sinense ZZ0214-1]
MFNLGLKGWFSSPVRSRVEAPAPNASATPRPPSPQTSAQSDGMSISAPSTLQHAHEPGMGPFISSHPPELSTDGAVTDRRDTAARATPRSPSPQLSARLDAMSISSSQQHALEPATRPSVSSQPPELSTNNAGSDRTAAAATVVAATVRSSSQALNDAFSYLSVSSPSTGPQSYEPAAPPPVPSTPQQRPEDPSATTDHDGSERARSPVDCTVIRRPGRFVGFHFAPARKERKSKVKIRLVGEKVTETETKTKTSMAQLQRTIEEKKKEIEKLKNRTRVRRLKSALKSRRDRNGECDVPDGSSRKPKPKKGVRFSNDDDDDSHPRIPTDWHSEVPSVPRYFPPPGTPYPSTMNLPDETVNDVGMVPTRPNTPPPMETHGLGLTGISVIRPLTAENIRIPVYDYDDNVGAEASDTAAITPVDERPATAEELEEAGVYLKRTFPELLSAAGYSASPTSLTPEASTPGLYAESHRSISPVESPLPKTPVNPPDTEAAIRIPKPEGYEEIFGRSDDEDSDDLGPSPQHKSEKPATRENAPVVPSQRLPTPLPAQAPALTETMVSDVSPQSPLNPSRSVPAVAPQREMSWTTLPVTSLPIAPQPFQVQPPFTQPSVTWGQTTGYQAPPPSWSQTAFSAPSSTSTWMAPPAPTLPSFPPQSSAAFYQPITAPPLPSFVPHYPPPQPEVDMGMDIDPFLDLAPSRPRLSRHRGGRNYRQSASQLHRVAAAVPGLNLRKGVARRLLQHLFVIRQPSTVVNAFQGDRALRKALAVQRRNRHALRHARRSVRPALRRLGRAARQARSAPQSAPQLVQRTMSIEMAIQDYSQTSYHYTDVDVDMDGGDLPAMPAVVELDEVMTPEPAVPPPAPLVRSASDGAMPVDVSVPTIVVTPGTPLPEAQPREPDLRPAPAPSASSFLSASFVPRPVVTLASEKPKSRVASPLRQESSLAEFEVPLVEAAVPAATSRRGPEPAVVAKPTPAVVVEPTPAVVVEPTPAVVPEAVVETQPPVTEAQTPVSETQPSIEDTGYETDDETEWEPVPVPPLSSLAPATSTGAEPAPVKENTPAPESAPVEEDSSAEAPPPVDVPAPHIATEGPQIVFHSYANSADDDDTVSLGYSEEDDEPYQEDGTGEEQDDENYQDDRTGHEEDEEAYEDDGTGEEGEYEENEEDSTEEQEGEGEEETTEYDESRPDYRVVKLPTSSAPAPASAPASSPAAGPPPVKGTASPSTPIPAPNPVAPSPVPVVSAGLPKGPYIGTVGEGFDWLTQYNKSTNSLFHAANVPSGNPLSGEAAMQARKEARLRHYANTVQEKKQSGNLIRSIAAAERERLAAEQSNAVPPPVLPETTPPRMSGERPIVVDKDGPESQSRDQDRRIPEQPSKDFLMSADERAETVVPRLNKGKGKATDWDAHLEYPAFEFDASSEEEESLLTLGLTRAEIQLNLRAFTKADVKGKARPSYQCYCRDLENGPSSGHTMACQNANGVSTTPLFIPKPSSGSAFGSSVSPSPTPALSAPSTHQDSQSSVLDASPIPERFSSTLETDVNAIFANQAELKSMPPSIGFPTAPPPVVHEQPSQGYEFVEEDAGQQITGVATAYDDLFAISVEAPTVEQSLPRAEGPSVFTPDYTFHTFPTSSLPPATVDPSALHLYTEAQWESGTIAAGSPLPHDDAAMDQGVHISPAETPSAIDLDSAPDPNHPLYEQHWNSWSSIPDQKDAFDIGVVLQDTAHAPSVTGSVDEHVPVSLPQVQEGDNVTSSAEEEREEEREIETETISYPLPASSNDEQPDHVPEVPTPVDVPQEEQPQLEPDVPVLVAGSPRANPMTEPSLQDVTLVDSQPPSGPSLPSAGVPQPLINLTPARVPTPPPSVHQEEIIPPVAEEPTEEPAHVGGTFSSVSEQAVEAASAASDVPAPPSTPLVRRRSGGPHDRIACPYERRTYFGRNPSSAQWNAFLQASPPKVNRVLSYNASKPPSPSLLTSPTTRPAVHPCGSNKLCTRSTSIDTTAIVEPIHPRFPSRGRTRRRPTIPAPANPSRSERDVMGEATQMATAAATTKKHKSKRDRKGKEETHVSPSSTPTASQPPCLPPSDSPSPSPSQAPSVPMWAKPPCCPDFSWTGQKPCIHALRASGHLVGTRWESESSDSELEEHIQKDVPSPEQGWSAGYFAKLSLAAGAFFLLERVVF